jgi:putative ABC transport system permease protein
VTRERKVPGEGSGVAARSVEAVFRMLVRLQPAEFRARHGDELIEFYRDAWLDPSGDRGLRGRAGVLARLTVDAIRSGVTRRLAKGAGHRDDGAQASPNPSALRGNGMDTWLQDLKWAVRSVVRRPGFALVVIATLALGVGANTAVFGVLNAVLLTPLPYDEPERLVRLYQSSVKEEGETKQYVTAPSVVHFREHSRTLDVGVFYNYNTSSADLTDGDRPERVRVLPVSADYFRVLRARTLLGRTFERAEERGGANIVVVSERIFRRYFAGDAGALGRELSVNGVPHTLIGVMSPDFDDPFERGIDLYLPLNLRTSGYEAWEWDNHYLSVVARLRPGATLESAREEVRDLARRQVEIAPEAGDWSAALFPLHEEVVGRADTMLMVLMAAVGLLLLIACVNIASLFLARGAARATELAVRSALGSPRRRMIRQLLAESFMLAVLGGLAGLLLAIWVSNGLVALAPTELRLDAARLDARVFAFSLGAALLAGVIFGVAPALRFTRPGLERVLREGGRSGAAGRAEGRARSVLVVAELSLALVLLIGAGVLMKSFDRLRRVELNLDSDNVVTFEVHLPDSRYSEADARARFHHELHARLASLPGVSAVGAVSRLPVTGLFHSWGVRRVLGDSTPDPDSPRGEGGDNRVVEGDFFSALRIPVVQGRVFGPQDGPDGVQVVVVNQALVRIFFAGENPIGRRITSGGRSPLEIIGVVADVPVSPRGVVVPMIYRSHTQYAVNRNWGLAQVVRLDRSRPDVLDAARRELAALDPALVLYEPRPLRDVIGKGIAQEQFAMLLLGAFAALAVLLAAVGIYGVLAYSVSRRRPEIGLRMALGARALDVHGMVMAQGARLAAVGIGLGIMGALALTRALSSLVFEVSVNDPFVFAAGAGAIFLITLVASGLPALAATRVDPLETMRE